MIVDASIYCFIRTFAIRALASPLPGTFVQTPVLAWCAAQQDQRANAEVAADEAACPATADSRLFFAMR
jgi:hypothetical protein